MRQLYKSTASQVVMLKLFLSSDHVSAATGKTLAVVISKNGGAFANPNAGATNATEVSNGWYKVTLDATDTDTEGDLVVRGTAASCDDAERICVVIGGDAYARLGAPAGASVSADIAAVKTQTGAIETDTQDIQSRLPAALVSGRIDASVGAMAANTITDAAIAADVSAVIADAVWNAATASYGSAGTYGVLIETNLDAAVSTRGTGDATAANQATIIAYIDTEVASILAAVDTEVAAIKAKTDNLPASPAAVGSAMALTSDYDFAKGTAAMTESYAAAGAAPTPAQILFELRALSAEKSISGTTLTAKKLDGATTAATYTLDDATTPSAITRAT